MSRHILLPRKDMVRSNATSIAPGRHRQAMQMHDNIFILSKSFSAPMNNPPTLPMTIPKQRQQRGKVKPVNFGARDTSLLQRGTFPKSKNHVFIVLLFLYSLCAAAGLSSPAPDCVPLSREIT